MQRETKSIDNFSCQNSTVRELTQHENYQNQASMNVMDSTQILEKDQQNQENQKNKNHYLQFISFQNNQQQCMRDGDYKRQKWIQLSNQNIMPPFPPQSVNQLEVNTSYDAIQNNSISLTQSQNLQIQQIKDTKDDDNSICVENNLTKFFKNAIDQEILPRKKINNEDNIKQESFLSNFDISQDSRRQVVTQNKMSRLSRYYNKTRNDITQLSKEQQQSKSTYTSKQIWIKGFFKILIYVNRFMFKSRQKLIFFRPYYLQQRQIEAINDLGNYFLEIFFIQLKHQCQKLKLENFLVIMKQITCQYYLPFFKFIGFQFFKNFNKFKITFNQHISLVSIDKELEITELFLFYLKFFLYKLANCNNGNRRETVREHIFRSQYRVVRKVRIVFLLAKKQFKKYYLPCIIFSNKLINFFQKMINPIPVILPYQYIAIIWEIIQVIFILINVLKIPFEISFLNGNFFSPSLTMISRIVFLINVFMQMNSAYYENGIIQRNRGEIVQNFFKVHFIFELVTNICLWFNPFEQNWLRMLFLLKFLTFYDIVEKFTESIQFSPKYNLFIKLMTLLIEVIFLCHLFACIWYSVGYYQQKQNYLPNWIDQQHSGETNIRTLYVSSIYFSVVTIGTIGYGDIAPQNELERAFLAGLAIITSGIFAYILTNIQTVYRKYNQKQKAYIKNLTDLNNYMINRSVNPILQQMARKYLKYIHDQNFKKGEIPCESLNALSKHLREEIIDEIFNKSINQIPILKGFSSLFRQALAQKMTETTFGISFQLLRIQKQYSFLLTIGPDEIIFKMGACQEPQLAFVLKGNVEISMDSGKYIGLDMQKQKNPFYICKQNHVFGEYEFISQSHTQITNARSLGISTIHLLKLSDFQEVIKNFQNDKEIYQQLKDSLNLYNRYSYCGIKCYCCQKSSHLTNECPIFFYRPIKQRIINLQNIQIQKKIEDFQRSEDRMKFSTLKFQNGLENTIKIYAEENQDQLDTFFSFVSLEEHKEEKYSSKEKQLFNSSNRNANASRNTLAQQESVVASTNNLEESCCFSKKDFDQKNTNENIYEDNTHQNSFAPKSYRMSVELSQQQNRPSIQIFENASQYGIPNSERKIERSQIQPAVIRQIEKDKKILFEENQSSTERQIRFKGDVKPESSKFTNGYISHLKIPIQSTLRQSMATYKSVNLLQNKEVKVLQIKELITETMRSYNIYMVHNNVSVVLKQMQILRYKQKEKNKKQKTLKL